MSRDGRFVSFSTYAPEFDPADVDQALDSYLFDRATGVLHKLSLATGGVQIDADCQAGPVSSDGRFVAIMSDSTLLLPGAPPSLSQAFLRDRQLDSTTHLSVSVSGGPANSFSSAQALSDDGRLVLLTSNATNLTSGSNNGLIALFLRDVQQQTTTRVVLGLGGSLPDGVVNFSSCSPDLRFVAFGSDATNLVPLDNNGVSDVFLLDRASGSVVRVSVSTSGGDASDSSDGGYVSASGRFVAFNSRAHDVVAGDTNGASDAFVRDLQLGTTQRVSLAWNGMELHAGYSGANAISADGSLVSMWTNASGVTPLIRYALGNTFVHDSSTGVMSWASFASGWASASNGAVATAMSSDGRYLLFPQHQEALVPGDTNGVMDVYVFDRLQPQFPDSDGDGWGDPNSPSSPLVSPPQGFVNAPFDCDDANAAIHRDAVELWNGVDDDCDGTTDEPYNVYCASALGGSGCLPTISASGTPSVAATFGFTLQAASVLPQRMGMFAYSLSPRIDNVLPGLRCIGVPFVRFGGQSSGGTAGACTGLLSVDFLAFAAANPVVIGQPFFAGQSIYVQAAFRDPSGNGGFSLTEALHFALCP